MKNYLIFYSYDIEPLNNEADYPIIRWVRDTFEIEFENGFNANVVKDKIYKIAESSCKPDEKVKYANFYKVEEV